MRKITENVIGARIPVYTEVLQQEFLSQRLEFVLLVCSVNELLVPVRVGSVDLEFVKSHTEGVMSVGGEVLDSEMDVLDGDLQCILSQ